MLYNNMDHRKYLLIVPMAAIGMSLLFMVNYYKPYGFVGLLFAIPVLPAAVTMTKRIPTSAREKISVTALILFLTYFFVQAMLHPVPSVQLRSLGQLFVSIIPGLLFGVVLFLEPRGRTVIEYRTVPLGFILSFAGMHIILFIWLFGYKYEGLLVTHYPPGTSIYQKLGDFVFFSYALFMVICSDAMEAALRRESRAITSIYSLVCAVAIFIFFEAQLIGSNACALLVAGGSFLWALLLLSRLLKRKPERNWVQIGRFGAVTAATSVLFLTMIFVSQPIRILNFHSFNSFYESVGSNAAPDIDGESGFDMGSLVPTSVTSRNEINEKFLRDQLREAPVLGDLGVDLKVGGWGEYSHSLLSVQTHLGAVGSVLMIFIILERVWSMFRKPKLLALKSLSPVILLLGCLSTFFTWQVLWFAIGGLYAVSFNGTNILEDNVHSA